LSKASNPEMMNVKEYITMVSTWTTKDDPDKNNKKCPYCRSASPKINKEITRTVVKNVKVRDIGYTQIDEYKLPAYEVFCACCRRFFELSDSADAIIMAEKFKPTPKLLKYFEQNFPNYNLEHIKTDILAITRPKQTLLERLFARNSLHAFFILNNQRFYVVCKQVFDVHRTILGTTIEYLN
jgi:hypothetical protein